MKPERDAQGVEMRLAQLTDAGAIAALLLAAFIEYKPLYTDDGFAATTPTNEQILDRMQEGPIWIVLFQQSIVGTLSVILEDSELYLRGMAVLPAARGQRAGGLLLKQVEDFALAHGCRRLFLSTTPFLSRAIRLYERFGFRRTEEGPADLFGTPLFTMEKML
jgi:GNAT superfamily N-acetyltransferase